jgi:dUTP pyrophosphatase
MSKIGENMTLNFARLRAEAFAPTRNHPEDAGVDVYALEDVTVWPWSYCNVHTGITLEIRAGTVILVRPKGRNNHLVGSGVIDAGYQGEIVIKIVNYSWKLLRLKSGTAIAQLIQLPVISEPVAELELAEIHAEKSARGASGGIHRT